MEEIAVRISSQVDSDDDDDDNDDNVLRLGSRLKWAVIACSQQMQIKQLILATV